MCAQTPTPRRNAERRMQNAESAVGRFLDLDLARALDLDPAWFFAVFSGIAFSRTPRFRPKVWSIVGGGSALGSAPDPLPIMTWRREAARQTQFSEGAIKGFMRLLGCFFNAKSPLACRFAARVVSCWPGSGATLRSPPPTMAPDLRSEFSKLYSTENSEEPKSVTRHFDARPPRSIWVPIPKFPPLERSHVWLRFRAWCQNEAALFGSPSSVVFRLRHVPGTPTAG